MLEATYSIIGIAAGILAMLGTYYTILRPRFAKINRQIDALAALKEAKEVADTLEQANRVHKEMIADLKRQLHEEHAASDRQLAAQQLEAAQQRQELSQQLTEQTAELTARIEAARTEIADLNAKLQAIQDLYVREKLAASTEVAALQAQLAAREATIAELTAKLTQQAPVARRPRRA